MLKKSLVIVVLSLGVLTFVTQDASAGWTYWYHLDYLDPESNDLGQGHRYEAYFVYLDQGESISIYQLSSAIDSFLYLVGPNGHGVAHDDDSAGGQSYSHSGRDACIYYTAPTDGWHIILASSYHPNQYGYYRLWVHESN